MAHSLRFYGNGVSFWVVSGQSSRLAHIGLTQGPSCCYAYLSANMDSSTKESGGWQDNIMGSLLWAPPKSSWLVLGGSTTLLMWSERVPQSFPTLCDPMDYSPPGSSVHGISQARILEWVAMPFSRESSQPRDQTHISCTAGRFFTAWATREGETSYCETTQASGYHQAWPRQWFQSRVL